MLTQAATPTVAPASSIAEFGGRLTLEGQSVQVATAIEARSGQIALTARGTGSSDGVTLTDTARLDATGQAKNFNGTRVTADGGTVTLAANAGPVSVQSGAKVDVSAAAEGGAAGRVAIAATSLDMAGELFGRAAVGARSGSADIDVGGLANFSALNNVLNAGGFTEERQVRLRSGDIAVAATDRVQARRVTLAADAGRIDVAGAIGTGAPGGLNGRPVALASDASVVMSPTRQFENRVLSVCPSAR